MASLKETVAERVAALGPAVQEGVIGVLVEQTKDKRVKAILAAISLLEEKQKELKKIKPEQTFDADGKVSSEYFTKANNETRKKTGEQIAKIEKALERACNPEKPEYDDLFKVVQNKGAAPATEEQAAE